MKPRVVILSAFLTPFRSGAEACAEEVPLRLADEFDFIIITARLRRDLRKQDSLSPLDPPSPGGGGGKGVRVIRVGLGTPVDKWLYPFLAAWEVRRHRPDIVHAILETFAGFALWLCRFTVPNAKRVLTLQTTNRSFLKGFVLRSPHAVTAISKHLADIAAEKGRKDVVVIPNGIDYAAIRAACEKHPKVPGRILFVGRLERMKGVDLLLRAFAQSQIANRKSQIALHIVGDGSQRSTLESLARELGIADRVRFLGYMRPGDVFREYAEAEIFCGLSRSEALGNVFLEAQAAGCAVVASEVGGIPEIVSETSSMLIDPDDAEALGKALFQVLNDSSLRMQMASAGPEQAKEYRWERIAQAYEAIYARMR